MDPDDILDDLPANGDDPTAEELREWKDEIDAVEGV